eukprot:GHVP01031647.1.p1 GENE.GHVP01031647.1~~GHVP01031647.1.p1  ORF type:complete len:173 (+),score=45.49 GHVP01031647.1:495-1013(+)
MTDLSFFVRVLRKDSSAETSIKFSSSGNSLATLEEFFETIIRTAENDNSDQIETFLISKKEICEFFLIHEGPDGPELEQITSDIRFNQIIETSSTEKVLEFQILLSNDNSASSVGGSTLGDEASMSSLRILANALGEKIETLQQQLGELRGSLSNSVAEAFAPEEGDDALWL